MNPMNNSSPVVVMPPNEQFIPDGGLLMKDDAIDLI